MKCLEAILNVFLNTNTIISMGFKSKIMGFDEEKYQQELNVIDKEFTERRSKIRSWGLATMLVGLLPTFLSIYNLKNNIAREVPEKVSTYFSARSTLAVLNTEVEKTKKLEISYIPEGVKKEVSELEQVNESRKSSLERIVKSVNEDVEKMEKDPEIKKFNEDVYSSFLLSLYGLIASSIILFGDTIGIYYFKNKAVKEKEEKIHKLRYGFEK